MTISDVEVAYFSAACSRAVFRAVRRALFFAAAGPTGDSPNLKVAPKLAKYCVEEGLISRALMQMNALSFSPPLVIKEDEVDEAISRFHIALDRVTDELIKAGSWKPK